MAKADDDRPREKGPLSPSQRNQLHAIERDLHQFMQVWEAEVAKAGGPTPELQLAAAQELKRVMLFMDSLADRAIPPTQTGESDVPNPRLTSATGFPRVWQLFPFLLPPSVRERIYEPAHEELKEDYLRARAICAGRYSRAWVAFCFTIRTAGLFAGSLWAAVGGTARKVFIAAVALLFGEHAVAAVRAKVAEWWGRLL